MKVLNLKIKQKYFDALLAGRKVREYREVRPNNVKLFVQLDEDGYEIEDENANVIPVHYDAIRFFTDVDTALVEVVASRSEVFVDSNGKPIMYEYGRDKKTGKSLEWVAERIVYDLGKILEYGIREQLNKDK